MGDTPQTDGPIRMIRYCVQGHEIVFTRGEIVRSVCPFCKSPIDRRRPPVPYDSVHSAEQNAEKGKTPENAPQRETDKEQTAGQSAAARETMRPDRPGTAPQPADDREEPSPELFGGPARGRGPAHIGEEPIPDLFGRPQGNLFSPKEEEPVPDLFGGPVNRADTAGNRGELIPDLFGGPSGNTGPSQDEEPLPDFFGGSRRSGARRNVPGLFADRKEAPPEGGNGDARSSRNWKTPAPGEVPVSPGLHRSPGASGRVVDRTPSRPSAIGGRPENGAASVPAIGSGVFLNYFGERLEIPAEGGWIGREGLGREWFDGNLMISRKHVYVHPIPQTGRLQVNEDKSLNGVFCTGKDGRRTRLESARMMEPGDVLWIYNIPLRIEGINR